MQQTRLDDQRSGGPSNPAVSGVVSNESVPDEDFFDMLVTLQTARLDEQRSPAPQAARGAGMFQLPAIINIYYYYYYYYNFLCNNFIAIVNYANLLDAEEGAANQKPAPDLSDDMSFFEMLAAAKAAQ